MRAVVVVESLTGNTRRAGELIARKLQQERVGITDVCEVRRPNHAAIQDADLVIVGTWVHGLFIVGQAPWGLGAIAKLPAISGKRAVAFCTFALNPKRSIETMSGALQDRGAEVIGGLALHRGKLEAHTDTFVDRLLPTLG